MSFAWPFALWGSSSSRSPCSLLLGSVAASATSSASRTSRCSKRRRRVAALRRPRAAGADAARPLRARGRDRPARIASGAARGGDRDPRDDRSGSMTATDIHARPHDGGARGRGARSRRSPRGLQGRCRVLLGQGRRGRAFHGRPRRAVAAAQSSSRPRTAPRFGDAITRSLDLGLSSLDEDKKTPRQGEGGRRRREPARDPAPLRRWPARRRRDAGSRPAQLAKDAGVPVLHGALGTEERDDPGPGRLRRASARSGSRRSRDP